MPRHMTIEAHGDVAVARIGRPPANALDPELLEDALAVLAELAADGPDAVVVTGRDAFFCAGLDLKVVPELDEAGTAALVRDLNRMLAGWHAFERPLVSAINGHAVAGGMIFALCGDRRIGSSAATYGLTEVRVGIPYPEVAIGIVRAELHAAAARRLVLGSDLVDAAAALELGALDEVAQPADVLDRSLELARELASYPADVYATAKRELRGAAIAAHRAVVERAAGAVAG